MSRSDRLRFLQRRRLASSGAIGALRTPRLPRVLPRPLALDYEYNDVADPESIYTRSDHYSYASKGVPVIFYTTGLHRDYHSVTDEVDKIEFGKMARIAELVHATAARLGNLDRAPVRDFAGPRVGKGQTGPIR